MAGDYDFSRETPETFAAFCRALYERELVVGAGGNVALKTGDKVLVTPSGYSLRALTSSQLIEVDLEGNVLSAPPGLRPSKELRMHLEIFKARPDVRLVSHVHGSYITAATTLLRVGDNVMPAYTPALCFYAYPLAMLPFFVPGTLELANAVGAAFRSSPKRSSILLKNHGLITVGVDFTSVLNVTEEVDDAARIFVLTRGKGDVIPDATIPLIV